MKLKSLLFLGLVAFSLVAPNAHAAIGQSKNVNNAGSSVICIPGGDDQIIVVQNNGTGSVRLSFDGGAGYVPPQGGKAGTNPTPTTGYLLAAGQQVILSTLPFTGNGLPNLHKPIVAILTTSTTTTLDIITDGVTTQFPTT